MQRQSTIPHIYYGFRGSNSHTTEGEMPDYYNKCEPGLSDFTRARAPSEKNLELKQLRP